MVATLVIVRDDARFSLTDGGGRSVACITNGKKDERVTGDGEFTSQTGADTLTAAEAQTHPGPQMRRHARAADAQIAAQTG